MVSAARLAAIAVLGAITGLSLAASLYVIIHSENRMLRDEQQICRVEQQDRSYDRSIARAAKVRLSIPRAPGC